jgi:hypothetical protein
MSFLILLISSLQQNCKRGQNRFCLEVRRDGWGEGGRGQGRELVQTRYSHMDKWINNKNMWFCLMTNLIPKCTLFWTIRKKPCNYGTQNYLVTYDLWTFLKSQRIRCQRRRMSKTLHFIQLCSYLVYNTISVLWKKYKSKVDMI